MPTTYKYIDVSINDLYLDPKNPRFSSSIGSVDVALEQTKIIEHLVTYADIVRLASRIYTVSELHGSELVTCFLDNGKYIVIEGNRRVCSCKLLVNRELIPIKYKDKFNFIDPDNKKVISNISKIKIALYEDRESLEPFLADRHITGVKKWSALEKNSYYMSLFKKYKNLDEVKKNTSESKARVKNAIVKYQFFIDVVDVLRKKYKNIEVDKLNYLPMVDRFKDTLLGDDPLVGLSLELDEKTLKYKVDSKHLKIYHKILIMVGEAFLIRSKDSKLDDSKRRIISTEISGAKQQKDIILNNIRIKGLIDLIRQFKKHNNKTKTSKTNGSYYKSVEPYCPKFKPQKDNEVKLLFTADEAKTFKLNGKFGDKINTILHEFYDLNVNLYPFSCASLYRLLLEAVTKETYQKVKDDFNESKPISEYSYILTTEVLFNDLKSRNNPLDRIKSYFATKDNKSKEDMNIYNCINSYMHHEHLVDVNFIINSWNTLKYYIKACLDYDHKK